MLKGKNISSGYQGKKVLHQLNFQVDAGEILCVIGANGSGKSTLLHSIMGLQPYEGDLSIQGEDLSYLSWKKRARFLALLAQQRTLEFPYTVWDTVSLGRYCHQKFGFTPLKPEDKEKIDQSIEKMGLWSQRNTLMSQLSGGQVQRVYFARCMVQDPKVILLDEPTNHLDLKVQLELMTLLKEWVSLEKRAVVAVFHDLNYVRQIAQQVLLLQQGKVLAYGEVAQVMDSSFLEEAYQLNVGKYMKDSYALWKNS